MKTIGLLLTRNADFSNNKLLFGFILFWLILNQNFHHGQTPIISFGNSIIGVGTGNGIHPNYRTGLGSNFFYGSINQDFAIKGIPLQAVGRLSNEPYMTGRASYFRISYQGIKVKKQNLDSLEAQISDLEKIKSNKQTEIYDLEGKLGYLNFLLHEYPNVDSVVLPQLATFDSLLPQIPKEVSVDLPNPELNASIPSSIELKSPINSSKIEQIIALFEFALKVKNGELSNIDDALKKLNIDFEKLNLQKYENFYQGISKVDIGLTSLPSAHLSNNALPIQGLKVQGKYRNWTYNVSGGVTITNKAFSNVALDQILNNSANLFNLSSFYQINSIKLVQATTLEYGDVAKNSAFMENYYTGPSMNKFKIVSAEGQSNATNIGGYFTPKFAPNLTMYGTFGISFNINDSLKRNIGDQLSFGANLKYRFQRAKSEFNIKYRRIGSQYNGFAQGIYISGTNHYETSYRQYFGRRLIATLTGARDEFSNMDTLIRFSYMNQATIDLVYKVGQSSLFYGSGTILQTDVSMNQNFSYQARLGAVLDKKFKKKSWQTTIESQYAKMIGLDSNQILAQVSLKTGISLKHWSYSVKGTFQHFEGIGRLVGSNLIIQPEVSYRYNNSTMSLNGQYLISEQFGRDFGLSLNWMYQPSPYVQWKLILQKWLVSETQFFMQSTSNLPYQPFYANFQMLIFLQNK